jgi:hypothetical protein
MGLLSGLGRKAKQKPKGDLELFFDENLALCEGASVTPLAEGQDRRGPVHDPFQRK